MQKAGYLTLKEDTATLAGRLFYVMKLKGFKSGLSVAKELNHPNAETINRILRGDSEHPSITIFADLVKKWPDISLSYVIAGVGEPLLTAQNIQQSAEPAAQYSLPDKKSNIDEKIKNLKILSDLKHMGDISPQEFEEYKSKL